MPSEEIAVDDQVPPCNSQTLLEVAAVIESSLHGRASFIADPGTAPGHLKAGSILHHLVDPELLDSGIRAEYRKERITLKDFLIAVSLSATNRESTLRQSPRLAAPESQTVYIAIR